MVEKSLQPNKKSNKKRKKPKSKYRKYYIISAAFVIPIIIIGTIFLYIDSKMGGFNFDDGTSNFFDPNASIDREGDDIGLDPNDPLASGVGNAANKDIYKDKDVLNFMILGTDERANDFSNNARSDSIMLMSLNFKKNTIKLVSFGRAIGFPVEGRQYPDWFTHLFRYGGADLMMSTVRDYFKIDVDKYIRINFKTFEQLVDAVGGVDIELTAKEANALNGNERTNAQTRATVYEGKNHLSGYDALQYSRLRYTDNDWKRVERQRTVIQAVVKQVNITNVDTLMSTVPPLIRTNFTKDELWSLFSKVPAFIGADIEQMTVPEAGKRKNIYIAEIDQSLVGLDFDEYHDILTEMFYGD